MDHKEPEWTAKNRNLREGDTTFETCGWCEFASCGSVRYGCRLRSGCSLMGRYGLGSKVFWDTVCIIKTLGKADLEDNISMKQHEIQESEGIVKRLKSQIKIIEDLAKKANVSPPLPSKRKFDYYDEDDVLYIFHDNKWCRSICVKGYRHHDGCVSYVLDDYPESKEGWGCGYAVPCVLKEWEYKYFKGHLDVFKQWLDNSDVEYNGKNLNLEAYYQAMGKE